MTASERAVQGLREHIAQSTLRDPQRNAIVGAKLSVHEHGPGCRCKHSGTLATFEAALGDGATAIVRSHCDGDGDGLAWRVIRDGNMIATGGPYHEGKMSEAAKELVDAVFDVGLREDVTRDPRPSMAVKQLLGWLANQLRTSSPGSFEALRMAKVKRGAGGAVTVGVDLTDHIRVALQAPANAAEIQWLAMFDKGIAARGKVPSSGGIRKAGVPLLKAVRELIEHENKNKNEDTMTTISGSFQRVFEARGKALDPILMAAKKVLGRLGPELERRIPKDVLGGTRDRVWHTKTEVNDWSVLSVYEFWVDWGREDGDGRVYNFYVSETDAGRYGLEFWVEGSRAAKGHAPRGSNKPMHTGEIRIKASRGPQQVKAAIFSAMKEMVGRDKELLGEAASILRLPLLAEDAQGAVAKQLDGVVDPTRKFILKLDRLEQAASDLLGAAKDAEKERRGSGVERAMRRTDLSGPMRSWEKELKGLYGLFAQGRNQMMAIASGAKIPTKRFSKKKPRKKGPQKLSSTKAIRELRTIAANMGKAIRDVGEKGSFSIRKAEEIAKKLRDGKLSGDKLRDELHAWVQLHLDFRDRVSAVLYGMAGGITKRINAIRASLRGLNEEFEPIELPWLAEEDYDEWCAAEAGTLDEAEAAGFSSIPKASHGGDPDLRRVRHRVTRAIFDVAAVHNKWTKEDERALAKALKGVMADEGYSLKNSSALAKALLGNAHLGQRTVNSGDLAVVNKLLDRHVTRGK